MNRQSSNQERDDAGRGGRGQRGNERSDLSTTHRAERAFAPFGSLIQLTSEMDRMFEALWRSPLGLLSPREGRWNSGMVSDTPWMPSLEMHEHDGEFIVRADLPGLRKQDVQVELVGQSLVIQGERRQGCEDDEDGWHHSECRYGRFVRSLQLPEHVDPDQIRAQFQDGILELRMPAQQRRESRRRIEVREGAGQSEDAGASRRRSTPSRRGQDAPEST